MSLHEVINRLIVLQVAADKSLIHEFKPVEAEALKQAVEILDRIDDSLPGHPKAKE